MYSDTPGYISALTYTVMDEGTYETVFAKLPKYIQVSCTFVYIGKRLPSATQKHYEIPWVAGQEYDSNVLNDFLGVLNNPDVIGGIGNLFGINAEDYNTAVTKNTMAEIDKFTDNILAETGDYEEVAFVE